MTTWAVAILFRCEKSSRCHKKSGDAPLGLLFDDVDEKIMEENLLFMEIIDKIREKHISTSFLLKDFSNFLKYGSVLAFEKCYIH